MSLIKWYYDLWSVECYEYGDPDYNDKVQEVAGCAAFVFFGLYIPIIMSILIALVALAYFGFFGEVGPVVIDWSKWQ